MTRSDDRNDGRDVGQAALEFVGVLPLVLIALVCALQLLVAGYTIVAVDDAARAAARACSNSVDPGAATAAARAALPDQLVGDLAGVRTVGEEVTVRVQLPAIVPMFPRTVLARSATYSGCLAEGQFPTARSDT